MNDLAGLLPDLAAAVRRETAGETIVWVGGPDPRGVFRSRLKTWLVGIPFLAFALVWELLALGIIPNGQASRQSTSDMLLAGGFGALFVLVGLMLIWTPFSWARVARKVAYVLTDRKMHIIGAHFMGAHWARGLKNVALASIKTVEVVRPAKAWNDLKLVVQSHTNSDGEVIETAMVLESVADSQAVEALIRARI
jgi:uncharacterized protein YjeT (DUF2065 family)